MEALEALNKIPQYGYRQFFASWYSVKFCMKASDKVKEGLTRLKKKYPMLYIHYAITTGNVIFGGTFHKDSEFHTDRSKYLAGCK